VGEGDLAGGPNGLATRTGDVLGVAVGDEEEARGIHDKGGPEQVSGRETRSDSGAPGIEVGGRGEKDTAWLALRIPEEIGGADIAVEARC
jgi:hypothetical protein